MFYKLDELINVVVFALSIVLPNVILFTKRSLAVTFPVTNTPRSAILREFRLLRGVVGWVVMLLDRLLFRADGFQSRPSVCGHDYFALIVELPFIF